MTRRRHLIADVRKGCRMPPTLSLILSTLLLLCSACSADEFDRCLGDMSFRDHEIPALTEALATEDPPSSYVATKGVSMSGLYYLVIANYEGRSNATMYRTGLGTRSIEMPAERGLSLYNSASESISVTRTARNKGVFDGENCHFVRAGSGQDRFDGVYVNPSRNESGDGIERMFYAFDTLLDAGYGEITFESYAEQDIPLPPEYSDDELAALKDKYSRNAFHELDELWPGPTN